MKQAINLKLLLFLSVFHVGAVALRQVINDLPLAMRHVLAAGDGVECPQSGGKPERGASVR